LICRHRDRDHHGASTRLAIAGDGGQRVRRKRLVLTKFGAILERFSGLDSDGGEASV
jgi:hypothetical protein